MEFENKRPNDSAKKKMLKRKYNIKLPDAIIASTCLTYKLPLVTADKGFSRILELDLFMIEI